MSTRTPQHPINIGNQHLSLETIPQKWTDLLLYIVGGMGLFVPASAGIGILTQEYSAMTLLLLAITSAVFMGGSVLYLGVLSGKTNWKTMGLWPLQWHRHWLVFIITIVALLIPIRSAVAIFFQILLEGNLESMMMRQSLLANAHHFAWFDFTISFISVAIMAPFFEELYFRGLLHRWFRSRWQIWPAIIASSAIFGLAHIDSVGVAFSSFILGIVMTFAYEKTGSLWISIAIHAVNNGLGIILVYLFTYFPLAHLALP